MATQITSTILYCTLCALILATALCSGLQEAGDCSLPVRRLKNDELIVNRSLVMHTMDMKLTLEINREIWQIPRTVQDGNVSHLLSWQSQR